MKNLVLQIKATCYNIRENLDASIPAVCFIFPTFEYWGGRGWSHKKCCPLFRPIRNHFSRIHWNVMRKHEFKVVQHFVKLLQSLSRPQILFESRYIETSVKSILVNFANVLTIFSFDGDSSEIYKVQKNWLDG